MADRPIPFSAPMVRALLAGTKTQTRRVLKRPTWAMPGGDFEIEADGPYVVAEKTGCMARVPVRIAVGDRLWVKETWADEHPLSIQEGRYSQPGHAGIPGPPGVSYRTIYRVDGEPLQVWRRGDNQHPYFTLDGPADEIAAQYPTVCSNFTRDGKAIHWGNSRFMPRWASRLTLHVTEVRVQRLQEISEADALAEGIAPEFYGGTTDRMRWAGRPAECYAALWETINGPGSWKANPWVVAYTFTVERCNIAHARAADA